MRADIHPQYRDIVFEDSQTGDKFLTRSTMYSPITTEFEGQTYPVVKLEVTSASHSFYTGKTTLRTATGQVEKFNKRFAKK